MLERTASTAARMALAAAAFTFAFGAAASSPARADQLTASETATCASESAYEEPEIVNAVADFFGVTAEAAGAAVSRVFRENGRPTGYIKGSEVAGAIGVGLRYGEGDLFMKNGQRRKLYWQGPSIGFDTGGNASKVFTLVYGTQRANDLYQRFPGVEGSAYFIGGIGINYQRANDITLAPMRAGVGLRAGANIGYLAYTKKKRLLPF